MGRIIEPAPAMLFVGMLASDEDVFLGAGKLLGELYGEVVMESPLSRWEYSEYYKEELGLPIFRKFLFFESLIRQDSIVEIKLKTNDIEKEFSYAGRRSINLDPGYLTPAKVVLASTKDYAHRIYMGRGIFAELTLIYRGDGFHPHINTYRDYGDYANIFGEARGILKAKLQKSL